ncbi:MAG: hypothetical protein EHM64_16105 [Ignavibacteriae bacterium]|nr:MAG: hypothetical protein EHM64_16105 [Ignavibacteriota bacterium]
MPPTVDPNFPGAEKHEITLEEAKKHIQRHKKNPIHPNHHGGSFDRAAVDKLLAQPDCAGLRIYHGKNEDGTPSLILVGVDSAGKDITPITTKSTAASAMTTTATASIMEKSWPCPPYCDGSSELLQ